MNTIVSDGRKRLEKSDEHRARVRGLKLEIETRYAQRLKVASILERVNLRVQMRLEFRRERAKLEPSHSTLFLER
jgi:hypothetical protein